jgi:hypothetical protein
MLVIPAPLPDEIARGYLGRIGQHNGLLDEVQIGMMLRRFVGSEAVSRREHAALELLASAAQIDLLAFLQHHTLLPYRKIVSLHRDQDAQSWSHRSLLWSQGMKALRTAAYFCPECVGEDIDFHGQSYWRRQHQLPGQLLCVKHNRGLRYVDSDNAWLKSPSFFLETAFEVSDEWVRLAMQNPLKQRFFEIWSGLAEQTPSIYSGVASRVFREKARALGFATRPGQTDRPWLSDRIVEAFGSQWLATICPILAAKVPGAEFPSIDRHILAKNGKSLAHYYVLIAAQLFDTADEALLALMAAQSSDYGSTGNVAQCRLREVTDSELIEAYVMAGGSHSKSARVVGLGERAAAFRLKGLGLPALSKGALVSLHAFYIEQKCIDESAKVGGLTVEQLLDLLRQIGVSFIKAMKRIVMAPSEIGPGSRGQRPKALNPHEMGGFEAGIKFKFAPQKKCVRRHLSQIGLPEGA